MSASTIPPCTDPSLFECALRGRPSIHGNGDSYDLLPVSVRDMHKRHNGETVRGRATVTNGNTNTARFVARLLRFPPPQTDAPLTTSFQEDGNRVRISRALGDHFLVTDFYRGPRPGQLFETFGTFKLLIDCACDTSGIHMKLMKFWLWRTLPLPLWLAPSIDATEFAKGDHYAFRVNISLPLIGSILTYDGTLAPANGGQG